MAKALIVKTRQKAQMTQQLLGHFTQQPPQKSRSIRNHRKVGNKDGGMIAANTLGIDELRIVVQRKGDRL